MNLDNEVKNVKTKEDFINFVGRLAIDYQKNEIEWENRGVKSYLEAIKSWIEDMEGYYINNNIKTPDSIDWNFIAGIFYVGKIYE